MDDIKRRFIKQTLRDLLVVADPLTIRQMLDEIVIDYVPLEIENDPDGLETEEVLRLLSRMGKIVVIDNRARQSGRMAEMADLIHKLEEELDCQAVHVNMGHDIASQLENTNSMEIHKLEIEKIYLDKIPEQEEKHDEYIKEQNKLRQRHHNRRKK